MNGRVRARTSWTESDCISVGSLMSDDQSQGERTHAEPVFYYEGPEFAC